MTARLPATPSLFGTDGLRGPYGQGWLTDEGVEKLGAALAHVLAQEEGRDSSLRPRLVMARDTRPSGEALAGALARGLASRGCDVIDLGVAPTPLLAGAIQPEGARAGAVISASHNPAEDNGIKLFSGQAAKLSEEAELEIEALLTGRHELPPFSAAEGAREQRSPAEVHARYREQLRSHLTELQGAEPALAGVPLIVDCAEGAASAFAPDVLRALGARVTAISSAGDGARINDGCGALHPEALADQVVAARAAAGLAFDGDADRIVMVDEQGTIRDGDAIVWVLAADLAERGRLPGGTAVGTVMSNLGLERSLVGRGLRLDRTQVGDRHVTARMAEGGYALGGEQAGHIVVRGPGPLTGDGLLAGLHVLCVMARTGKTLAQLCEPLELFPQVLLNLKVGRKPPLESLPGLMAAQRDVEQELGASGRILLRYSGTERKLRIMVEAGKEFDVAGIAARLAAVAQRELA